MSDYLLGRMAACRVLLSTLGLNPVADGSLTAADLNAATFSNTFWKVDGNVGTTPSTHFLGTTDNQPLELKVVLATRS